MGNAPVGGLPFEMFVPDHSIDHLRRFLHMGLDGFLAKRNQPSANNSARTRSRLSGRKSPAHHHEQSGAPSP